MNPDHMRYRAFARIGTSLGAIFYMFLYLSGNGGESSWFIILSMLIGALIGLLFAHFIIKQEEVGNEFDEALKEFHENK